MVLVLSYLAFLWCFTYRHDLHGNCNCHGYLRYRSAISVMGPWPCALYSLHAHVVPFYSNSVLLQSHIDFVVPPARNCIWLHFHSRSMSLRHGSFSSFLTLGHKDIPVQAYIRLLALVLRRPNHMLANSLVPVMLCDYDYEETNIGISILALLLD